MQCIKYFSCTATLQSKLMAKPNKSFLYKATKNATRNHDAAKLDILQDKFSKYRIPTIREHTICDEKFSTPNKLHIPDITINKEIILEHDTAKIHGELGFENKKTLARNTDYHTSGRPFCVINEDLCKELFIDQGSLAIYLYYHELMKINCIQEAHFRK